MEGANDHVMEINAADIHGTSVTLEIAGVGLFGARILVDIESGIWHMTESYSFFSEMIWICQKKPAQFCALLGESAEDGLNLNEPNNELTKQQKTCKHVCQVKNSNEVTSSMYRIESWCWVVKGVD